MSTLRLLPPEALISTGEFDHADWNYRPLLGALQKKRFELVLALMGNDRYGRLLEVGYGSGVFMPELASRCRELHGVDPHPKDREVAGNLAAHGVDADLVSASATELPYEDSFFDCAVAVSSLEYVEPIEVAAAELVRVLVPTGVLFVVTPGHSPILDLALRLSTGEDPHGNYGDRRPKLIAAILERFRVVAERNFPRLGGPVVYRALRLTSASEPA